MSQRKDTLRTALQKERDALLQVIAEIKDADWSRPTEAGWTIREVLAHLAGSQPTQPIVIRNILAGQPGPRPDFNLEYFNKRQVEKRQGKSPAELLAELAAGHADTLKLLDELSEADLDRPGNHPALGETTLEGIFQVIARHDQQHTEHIRRALG